MRPLPHDSMESADNPRTPKPRPQPLELPRDLRYGTMDGINIANGYTGGGSLRGSRTGGTRDSIETAPLWNYASSPHSPLVQIRDHCHQQWVAVVLTLLLLGITVYFVFGLTAPIRADQCVTPFGTLLGESGSIGAFSNCRNDYGGDRMDHFVSVGLQRLYTGSKWHALEYARRYWVLSSLITFPSLPAADHLMTQDTANVVNGRRGGRGSSFVLLERYTNMFLPRKAVDGDGTEGVVLRNLTGDANNVSAKALLLNWRLAMPEPRDLIVYAKNRKTLPDAHVAVVVAVRGPYRSVVAAGSDVHWYIVKNASTAGRQPLSPEATLPRELLAKDHGTAIETAASEEKRKAAAAAGSDEGREVVAEGASLLYYKVYVAEQNWDNTYWKTSAVASVEDVRGGAGGNLTHKRQSKQPRRKAATRQPSYTRVLLLHEYSRPHGFFLEDTHNNPILGWVRAPSEDISG